MRSFTDVSSRSTHFAFLTHFGKFLLIIAFISTTVGVSSAAAASLSRVSCRSNSYTGPGTVPCSVYLAAKTSTRTYVTLASNNAAVTVPSAVTVKPGSLTTGFAATLASVTTPQTATITAQTGGTIATFSISLSPSTGGASGTAAVTVNATSISFGTVALNTPVAQAVTVSSTGTAPLTVSSAVASGVGFSVSGPALPVTLNPGQSSTLEVGFDPTTATSYSGRLTIGTNVASPTVTLSGTGVTGITYAVNLNWSAPTGSTDPVVGYNVYRAPSGSNTFQRLNASADTQTTFTDSSVQSGTGYNYYVKSVDAQGVESPASNTMTVTIP